MWKASIQRHVRLGNVARQLSTVSLMRSARSNHLAAILRQTPSQPALRRLAPTHVFSRLYTAESSAAEADGQGRPTPAPPGLITRFADLSQLGVNEGLIQALTRGMGYETMTEVQSMAINPALKGVDMVAQAKTGTGKTLAFLVPLFQRVLVDQPQLADRRAKRRSSSEDIRAIILSPTRELAEQIGVEARKLAKNTGIVVQTAVGGTRKRESLWKMWNEGCDVLVATPGRLNDLLTDPAARVAAPKLQAFVLDEADRMLDVGFTDEIRAIQDSLPSPTDVERQTLLFSATIPRDVVHLAKSMVRANNFEFVQTIKADDVATHESVPQHLVTIQGLENVYPVILEIAEKAQTAENAGAPFKAIVFFSNTASVQYAYEIFRRTRSFSRHNGTEMYEIHSKLTQSSRTRSADYFRKATSAVLFSSDVTARGMDFPNVTDVIQIGLPPDRDQYIHRVGRTGRAGNSGKGWLILTPEEVREARERLTNLPIKPNDTIESAKFGTGDSSAPEAVSRLFKRISDAYVNIPASSFRAVYMANLGQKFGRFFQAPDMIRMLNDWCLRGMGWKEPPAIPPKIADMRGLRRIPGVRVGYDEEVEPVERGFGHRFGSESSFSRDSSSDSRGGYGSRGSSDSRGGYGRSGRSGRNSFEDRFSSRDGGSRDTRSTPRSSF
ncbi:DEAD-domain-containing protein [Ustulina deusta]|nr:DEAD-domain-containing protein [Ustulina deusta]